MRVYPLQEIKNQMILYLLVMVVRTDSLGLKNRMYLKDLGKRIVRKRDLITMNVWINFMMM